MPPDTVDKLRKIFGLLDAIESPDELPAVTIDADRMICDVNLEDYH